MMLTFVIFTAALTMTVDDQLPVALKNQLAANGIELAYDDEGNVVELSVFNESLTESTRQLLGRLSTTTRSVTFWAPAKDADLALISTWPVLESLDFFRAPHAISDAGWKALTASRSLISVAYDECVRTDDVLAIISRIPTIKQVSFRGSDTTDKGLEYIAGMRHLEKLDVTACPITDEGLKHLSKLESLRTLYLNQTRITNNGLRHLTELKLQDLEFGATAVTDQGLAIIGSMRSIRELDIRSCKIGDNGLIHLGQLPNLKILFMMDTEITDKSVEVLSQMKSLKRLCVSRKDLSRRAVRTLQRALPDCQILR